MAKFRKKPIVIEAMQFTGGPEAATPIIDWMLANDCAATWSESFEAFFSPADGVVVPGRPEGITIQTLEGAMLAQPGDWVIQGVRGEFYPCKPEIFTLGYDPEETL